MRLERNEKSEVVLSKENALYQAGLASVPCTGAVRSAGGASIAVRVARVVGRTEIVLLIRHIDSLVEIVRFVCVDVLLKLLAFLLSLRFDGICILVLLLCETCRLLCLLAHGRLLLLCTLCFSLEDLEEALDGFLGEARLELVHDLATLTPKQMFGISEKEV